ncbi:DNA sulfur modification protein DndB [Mucilaginibacter pocheonensis]|uniref:DGQHR domain-containing protein n=1 Tax=Mucilaginibacter pocheonensis TaxID=398050 RepID=A0ABU1T9T1_9SPHI|nr:DNA sulfur modification protein DndB [Mucilaginibacter pocheonensis]MDR6942168.1 hypothetical protein [Mucilaginibacter pocheonensis]
MENYSQVFSLEEALSTQNSYGRPVKTFIGFNIGYRTFTVSLSLFEIQEMTEVANEQSKSSTEIAQRKLDINHASNIATYILKGLLTAARRKKQKHGLPISKALEEIQKNLGMQPYLSIPPLVASLRNCEPNGTNLKVTPLQTLEGETSCFKIYLNPGDTLWIVDGQHRRMGLHLTYEFLKNIATYHRYPTKGSLYKGDSKADMSTEQLNVWADCFEMLRECYVSLEVHLGLSIDQERQLFHDLNNLSKKVDKSLALNFDGSNPVNSFVKEVIIDDLFNEFNFSLINDKEKTDWNSSGLTRQELVAINALLFMNKTNINGAVPAFIEPKLEIAREFWENVLSINNINDVSSKQLTVAAQPVVLKALAKLTFDLAFGKNKEWAGTENAKLLSSNIKILDFSHDNPMWRYYDFSEEERVFHGLEGLTEYLPSEDEGYNRDIGKYDEHTKVFRFGAKHNDIYPIIGDMIRWSIGLPSRRKSD